MIDRSQVSWRPCMASTIGCEHGSDTLSATDADSYLTVFGNVGVPHPRARGVRCWFGCEPLLLVSGHLRSGGSSFGTGMVSKALEPCLGTCWHRWRSFRDKVWQRA